MRSRYKISEQHGWYFVTSTTIQWIPLFTNQNYFDIILTSLKFSQLRKDLKIYAFVIMDNHFHAILQHSNLSGAMQSIKSYTAGRIIKQLQIERKSWALDLLKQYKQLYKTSSNYQIWQEGFHPQLIENDSILTQKLNIYIIIL